MANCVMHLFQNTINPSPQTPLADFLAAEADYDGYAPLTIVAWGAPVLAGVGYSIYAPTQTFRFVFSDGVVNTIAGYFLVTSGGALKEYCVFGSPVPMSGNGMATIKTPIEVFSAG